MGGMSLQTRREIVQFMLPKYCKASSVKKRSRLLDVRTATAGYNHKYAMRRAIKKLIADTMERKCSRISYVHLVY